MMLPHFRIRGLHGPVRGIVQLSAPQYDSTLKSHPNAALTYLDDDDGETITVGSGFELSQRLYEPVTAPTAAFDYHSVEEKDMHTFDIKHTSDSLAVWKDHEAYTSKNMSNALSTASISPENKAVDGLGSPGCRSTLSKRSSAIEDCEHSESTKLLAATFKPTNMSVSDQTGNKAVAATNDTLPNSGLETSTITQQSTETASSATEEVTNSSSSILKEVDMHIDGLADFLQGTSNVLAKVAHKTRETDTSTIEGVLNGFKGIFEEVLMLAKSALESFDTESAVQTTSKNPAQVKEEQSQAVVREDEPAKTTVEPKLGYLAAQLDEWCAKPAVQNGIKAAMHEFIEAKEKRPSEINACETVVQHNDGKLCSSTKDQITGVSAGLESATESPARVGLVGGAESEALHCDNEDVATKKKVSFQVPPPPATSVPIRFRHGIWLPRETAKAGFGNGSRSILDIDTEPEFSARYPPLMSLRRSRTVDTLRQRSKSPPRSTTTHQEALKRYPSVQQLEGRGIESRGKEFHKTHEVDRLVKEDEVKAIRQPMTPAGEPHLSMKFDHMKHAWLRSRNEEATSTGFLSPPTTFADTFQPSKAEFPHSWTSHNAKSVLRQEEAPVQEQCESSRNLPGAWPETQFEAGQTALPTSHESSGAFFHRMTAPIENNQPLPYQPAAEPLFPRSSEVQSPPHYMDFNLQPQFPLHRAKSISALNPAARLTKPFDPLVPRASTPSFNNQAGWQPFDPGFLNPARVVNRPLTPPRYHEREYHVPTSPVRGTARPVLDGVDQPSDLPRRSATERQTHRRRPYTDRFSGMGRLSWENFETEIPKSVRPCKSTPHFGLHEVYDAPASEFSEREMRSKHHGSRERSPEIKERIKRHRTTPGKSSAPEMKSDQVDNCVKQLRSLGYGKNDPHEAARLKVYAGASAGDLMDAVEMIEEDRKAVQDFIPKGVSLDRDEAQDWF